MALERIEKYQDFIGFLEIAGKSKELLRSGWVREKVDHPESVADHSFRVGLMAMIFSEEVSDLHLDQLKLMKMALLHDLGEVITGDLVTERFDLIDVKARDKKENLEREGLRQIFGKIGRGEEYVTIFEEMVARDTEEAIFFWQLDKLEMVVQAFEYEKSQGKDLEEFFLGVQLYHLKHPLLKKIFEGLMERRRRIKARKKQEEEEKNEGK